MKIMTVDIDVLEDFLWVLKQAQTVLWVNTQASMEDVLFIVPTAGFPAQYTHHAKKSGWRDAAEKVAPRIIEATLNDE
jgi:hypothetical protein